MDVIKKEIESYEALEKWLDSQPGDVEYVIYRSGPEDFRATFYGEGVEAYMEWTDYFGDGSEGLLEFLNGYYQKRETKEERSSEVSIASQIRFKGKRKRIKRNRAPKLVWA